jgi:SAM-dependent methyltransferase
MIGSIRTAYRRIRPVRAAVLGNRAHLAVRRITTEHRLRAQRVALFEQIRPLLTERRGFEVGGPSTIFDEAGLIPAYPIVATLDNANFSSQTIWEGSISEGATFRFHPLKPAGRAFIAEATDLGAVADSEYDFVLSSHTLEHVANPIVALREWRRILRPGGALIIVLPRREAAFDHRRPVTSFEHLVDDERRGTQEDDLTHLEEILALHDLDRDPGGLDRAAFEARSRRNAEFRALHHHVFDVPLLARLLEHAGFEVSGVTEERPLHLVGLAHRPRDA